MSRVHGHYVALNQIVEIHFFLSVQSNKPVFHRLVLTDESYDASRVNFYLAKEGRKSEYVYLLIETIQQLLQHRRVFNIFS